MANDNKITLTVASLSGSFTDDFNIHQKVDHIIKEANRQLNITPASGEKWQLTRPDDSVIDPNLTIAGAGLTSGMTLTYAPEESGGGA